MGLFLSTTLWLGVNDPERDLRPNFAQQTSRHHFRNSLQEEAPLSSSPISSGLLGGRAEGRQGRRAAGPVPSRWGARSQRKSCPHACSAGPCSLSALSCFPLGPALRGPGSSKGRAPGTGSPTGAARKAGPPRRPLEAQDVVGKIPWMPVARGLHQPPGCPRPDIGPQRLGMRTLEVACKFRTGFSRFEKCPEIDTRFI